MCRDPRLWVSPLESGAQSLPVVAIQMTYPCQASIASDPDINHVFKAAVNFLQDLVYKLPPPRVNRNEVHNSTHYYPPVITSGLGLWTRRSFSMPQLQG